MGQRMTGEEALALGALKAGVRFVTGYPGTPSKGIFTALQRFSSSLSDPPLSFHWATNEKVALELAIGATLAGLPSLVCVKSVGANVLLDALMTVNLTGVPSPLVIALGDDPSAWTSQNEQDSRWLAWMSELPLLEPTTVSQAPSVMHEAFHVSAEFLLPIILRFPKAFAIAEGEVDEETEGLNPILNVRGPSLPSIASGGNAVRLHARLHEKLRQIGHRWDTSPLNTSEGNGPFAVVAVGFCALKVRGVLRALSQALPGLNEHLSLLTLTTTHPLPRHRLLEHLSGKRTVLVVEEGEPIVETLLKALIQEGRFSPAIRGKLTGDLPREGELTLRQIGKALRGFLRVPPHLIESLPNPERPQAFTLRFCEGCPYPPFLEVLKETCKALGVEPVVGADPGCAIVAIGAPYELVRIKHSMGGAVNIIAGLAKFEGDPKRRYIAFVGDSDFFHGAVTGILNAAYWRVPMAIIVLDNSGAAFTGGQPHPGSGFNAFGEFVPPTKIEALLEGAGIPTRVVSSRDTHNLPECVRWALDYKDGPKALIVREPCPFVPIWTEGGELKPQKTEGKIVGE